MSVVLGFVYAALFIWDFEWPDVSQTYSKERLQDSYTINYFLNGDKIESLGEKEKVCFKTPIHEIWWLPTK